MVHCRASGSPVAWLEGIGPGCVWGRTREGVLGADSTVATRGQGLLLLTVGHWPRPLGGEKWIPSVLPAGHCGGASGRDQSWGESGLEVP